MRERVVDLLLALTQRDYQSVSEAFYDMAVRTRPVNMGQFAGEVADLLDSAFIEHTLDELDLGGLLAQLGELGVRFGMRVPAEYAMMIKAILTLEGVGKTLAPDVDPIEAARPYVVEVLRDRYSPERLGTEAARTLLSMSRVARELPPTVHEMLRSVEGGRVRIGVDVKPGADVGPLLGRSVSPITDALLTGGFTVAGALALPYGEPLIVGLPPTSLVLFAIALLFLGRTLLLGRSSRKK
jgi:ubiquinone biosynthesis protein